MSKEELIILKYINEYKQLPKQQIYEHFQKINLIKKIFFRNRSAERFSDTSIVGCLFLLEVNHNCIRANKDETLYTITDVGEIEAYSYVIEQKEIWKNRIYGFLFGVATTLTGMLVKFLIGLL